MSMSNFIGVTDVGTTVMAASNSAPRDRTPSDEPPERDVGLDHPTVVPTNFDPEEYARDDE